MANNPPSDRPAFEDACAQAVQTATGMPSHGEGGAWQGVHETCDRIDKFKLNWDAYSASQGAFCRSGSDAIKIEQNALDVLAGLCKAINVKYLEPPTPIVAPRPTRADVLKPMANYCNQTDSRGQVIYGPSLPAAIEKGWADEWFEKDRALGSTHWIYGPMDPGQAYPGDFPNEPLNPDSLSPDAFRALALNILNRPSASGRGYVPVCFLDGGGEDPKVRIDSRWKGWGEAVADIQEYMIIVPAWEPVGPGGAWSTTDMSYALERIHEWFPKASLWVHTVPLRGSFAGNPPESDPVWHGDEAECWKSHGGQFADGHFYQTDHGDNLYPPTTCSCAKWPEKFGHQNSDEACQFNRHEDSVARSGAGHNGWRVLPGGVCLMETVAYEFYRKNRDLGFPNSVSQDAMNIAKMAGSRVYDKWNVTPTFGNGMQ